MAVTVKNYCMNYIIPGAYKFHPTDEELILFYLRDKNRGGPVPSDAVKECDLYGSKEPWEIWEMFDGGRDNVEDHELYFFTKTKYKKNSSIRIERRVGSGSWKSERAADEVHKRGTKICIGYKKRFHYFNENNPEQNGGWIMHEYRINQEDESVSVFLFFLKIHTIYSSITFTHTFHIY